MKYQIVETEVDEEEISECQEEGYEDGAMFDYNGDVGGD